MFVINHMRDKTSEFVNVTIPTQYAKANRFSKICMIMGGLAAAEMALGAVGNTFSILRNGGTEILKYNFSANLGGAIYYGISALNPIPGTASIAGIVFSLYSYVAVEWNRFPVDGTYLTSEIVGRSIKCLGKMANVFYSEFFTPVVDKIIRVVEPIFLFIYDYTAIIASRLVELVSHLNLSLPKHPIWLPVGCLITALFIYKVVYPTIKSLIVKKGTGPSDSRV